MAKDPGGRETQLISADVFIDGTFCAVLIAAHRHSSVMLLIRIACFISV
jgi:hypothetical protein